MSGRRSLPWWQWLIVGLALLSVPGAIGISGYARNAANDQLCDYIQEQWYATEALKLRFTAPGSESRAFLDDLFGKYPNC